VAQVGKRSYVSAKRNAQAESTKRAILHAAQKLFTTHGYVRTTMQDVADEAEVAVQTVYAVFGNKRELLRQVLEAAVAGDGDVALVVQAMSEEPDPQRRARLDAVVSTQISQRILPIYRVVREAAAVDTDFAATADAITPQRRVDMRAAARVLAGQDGLKVPLEEAVGTLYVLYSPEVFAHLTEDLGWSVKRYERWLATMLQRTLLLESS